MAKTLSKAELVARMVRQSGVFRSRDLDNPVSWISGGNFGDVYRYKAVDGSDLSNGKPEFLAVKVLPTQTANLSFAESSQSSR